MTIHDSGQWDATRVHPELSEHHVHVWRIALDDARHINAHYHTLSAYERQRADRFNYREHSERYTVAHSMLRRVLAGYTQQPATSLELIAGPHGKPQFASSVTASQPELHFNLSHSAGLALVAVSRTGPVGIDVEWWRPRIQHLAVAERFFSVRERESLLSLGSDEDVARGFYTAWSRKEAYLKATGFGISRGLHHFDVTLVPHAPAEILQDRLDASATERWAMANIEAAPSYSAALVASRPVTAIKQFQALDTA